MRFITQKIKRAWLVAKCLPRLSVVVFRYANGRWYIFRDQPDWFVEAVSKEVDADPRIEALFEQAKEELQRRLSLRATQAAKGDNSITQEKQG